MDKNNILIELSESTRTSFGKKEFSQQSKPQKVFSAIWALESEVNNGGFSQYFASESCETSTFVVEALEAIGAPQTAELCKAAITIAFPNGLPQTPGEISSAASDFSEETLDALEPLDQSFFAYPHDLTELLFTFVAKHPEEFGPMPCPD